MTADSTAYSTTGPAAGLTPDIVSNGHIAFDASHASRQRQIVLPDGVRLAEYRNGNERVYFQKDHCHTFSLYLDGGFETYRTDQQARKGAPGHFCLMPQGSYSAWDVGSQQQFVHLYFDDDYLKRLALKTFDIDPRLVSLPQLTFSHDPALDALCRYGMLNWDWQASENTLAVEQAVQMLLVKLIKQLDITKPEQSSLLTAGLAPHVRERVLQFIYAHFNRQITLAELATVAGLSEYHFCRMFKVSLAQTPQQYVTRLRVEQAMRLLDRASKSAGPTPSLADIALACGFSSQSHMGRFFKQQTGLTPGRYLKSQR